MKRALKALFLVIVAAASLNAQDRGRPSSDSGSSSGASIASRGVAVGNTTSSSPAVSSVSRDYGTSSSSSISVPAFSSPAGRGYSNDYRPSVNLTGTSFQSIDYYYSWQNFIYRLQLQYGLNDYYFRRFYRNSEPLVTPAMMKLALRSPLALSTQLLREVDSLQEMLAAAEAGKQVDKKVVAEKTQLIRELARKIRKDQYLEFLDRRNDKDVSQGIQTETLGLAAITQLRQWAVDLNSQLKGMYSEMSTSTVSVQNLVQPSFDALAKGIEKMTKVIDDSSRKL
jgi:hypothetical protein